MKLSHDTLGRLHDESGHIVGKMFCPAIKPCDIAEITRAYDETRFTDQVVPKTQEELAAHVIYLQTLQQPEQHTSEWHKMREARLSASDVAGAIRDTNHDTPFDVLVDRCGHGHQTLNDGIAAQWAEIYKPIATSIYQGREAVKVVSLGLLPHSSIPYLGTSPDGVTESGRLLKISCPMKGTTTGELVVPYHCWKQIQLQLEVCDLEECDFIKCKFDEYQDPKDFFSDSEPSSVLKTRDGFQKGVYLEWYDTYEAKSVYKYSPLHINYAIDLTKWIAQTKFTIRPPDLGVRFTFLGLTYWRLSKYSVVPVKRDRQWWNGVLPSVKSFWREVCYYRTQPPDVLYRDHGKSVDCIDDDDEAPEPPAYKVNGNPFLTSDDEEEPSEKDDQVPLPTLRRKEIDDSLPCSTRGARQRKRLTL